MKRFILIDDDDIICVVHPAIIRQAIPDAVVDVIQSGPEAIELLNETARIKTEFPTAIFLDINMPEFNGFELIDRLLPDTKEFLLQIPLFVLSSSIDQRDLDRAEASPYVQGFIGKPLTIEFLKSTF